jgi:hypothetical protein
MAASGVSIRCVDTAGEPWKEIDGADDLDHARAMFGTNR